MSKIEKDLGASSAYAYAVQYGEYTGTEEEYGRDMANLANISAEAETLSPDEEASASYSGGVLSFGIPQGVTGNGIASAKLNSDFTLTLTFTDGTIYTTPTPIRGETGAKGDTGETGATGETGNGIASIAKTGTSGLVDTYTITFTDGTTTTFDVTNGAEAIDDTLTVAGRAADAKATGDVFRDVFTESAGGSATLTNIENVSEFYNGRNAVSGMSYVFSNNVLTLTANGASETSPYIVDDKVSVGVKKWICGFKYRLTKIDSSLTDPQNIRIHLGSTAYDFPVVWGEWNLFSETATLDLTRIRFALRNFSSAPASGTFKVEIKDMYLYDAVGLSTSLCTYVMDRQNEDYRDGTVVYTLSSTYSPDKSLGIDGKAADAKATGDAIAELDSNIDTLNENLMTTKSATLTDLNDVATFFSYGSLQYRGMSDGVATFTPNSLADANVYMSNDCQLGNGKHLVGFKYRLTKTDSTLTDPSMVRVTLGASERYDNSQYTYGDWIEFAQVTSVDLTRVYFTARGFSTAPTSEQFKVEIKEFYIYDVSGIDADLTEYIIDEQNTNYQSGTVEYSKSFVSEKITNSLGRINVKDYDVKGDGITDDTNAIRAILSKELGVYYFPSGTYLISGTITIPKNTVIYGDGDDTVFSLYSALSLTACTFRGGEKVYPYILVQEENVILKQFKLIGNDTLLQQRHAGIGVLDTERVTIKDLTIYNINFDANQDANAVVSGYGICVTRSKYVSVSCCDVRRCGYECIGVVDNCDYCTVRDCYTQDGWRTCIQVHRGSCNTIVENCYMKQTHSKYDACFTVHGLQDADLVKNLRVENCTCECTQNGAQPFDYCAPMQIMSYAECPVFIGNRVFGGKRAFYITTNSYNAKIIGNDFQCNDTSDYGVTISSPNTIAIGNRLSNDAETGNVISNTPVLIGNIGIS